MEFDKSILFDGLDRAMKGATLELLEIGQNNPRYNQTLKLLYDLYQGFVQLSISENDGLNNRYYMRYANLDEIEVLLRDAGYLKASSPRRQ